MTHQDDCVILRFCQCLRLGDNPALQAAIKTGKAIIPVYVLDENSGIGAASRWWLYHSLQSLDADLRRKNSRLIFKSGPPEKILAQLQQETGAKIIFSDSDYVVKSNLLIDPAAIKNRQGNPYQVFTPFYKACMARLAVPNAGSTPEKIPAPLRWPQSENPEHWPLNQNKNWARGFSDCWQPGERGAQEKLKVFLTHGLSHYTQQRDIPANEEGVSRLSPHLHFGEISPRQVWAFLHAGLENSDAEKADTATREQLQQYVRQLIWREFAHYLLHYFPHTVSEPLKDEFKKFPWQTNPDALKRWQQGQTGYPIVDAGMRELWQTGWMHNRVRMIVGSFLVKDLLLPWQEGAAWFWDTLVDADLANNTLGWQWIGGCGADAAPYFRVFNPVLQGEKFDADGDYVRRWVPELKDVAKKNIHKPWELDSPPANYPPPMVDHKRARDAALKAYQSIKR